jgi:predicted nucleic acid-binding Zn ribbon protein
MKQCPKCEAVIPDEAKLCPHCRLAQKRGDRLPQMTLVGFSLVAAVAVLFDACPSLPGG